MNKKIIIVGGVAAGMSAASKAKRIDKNLDITVYEMTDAISWGACGLPYYVGDFYSDSSVMVARTYEEFKKGIETNTLIENNKKSLKAMNSSGDKEYRFYRGSFLAWSRDHIRYQYSGGRIRGSWGWQETGAVWPNEVQKKGIYRIGPTGGWSEKWLGNKKLIGHNPMTGNIIFGTDWIDYFRVNANGQAWKE